MNKKQKEYYYFKICIDNLITNPFILFVFVIIEYLSIYSNLLITISQITSNTASQNNILHYFSIFNIMKKYLGINDSIPFGIILFLIVSIVVYYIYVYSLSQKIIEKNSCFYRTFKLLLSNYFELFFFRILWIIFIDCLIRTIVGLTFMMSVLKQYVGYCA